mmetsp:Transcript_77218/g.213531  ORF Transcript_77218/g.213531 Transcript_77218/m.213531 type:complete len:282 (+) Transcript_77218:735-1580(+)
MPAFRPCAVPPSGGGPGASARRIAAMAASRARAARSAPLKPPVRRASAARSTSPANGSFLVCARRISRRPASEGKGTKRRRSRRPGRSIAGSTMSGLFVAAITYTCARCCTPSISVSIWFTTRSAELEPSADLRGTSASSSSKKMTHGAELNALWNTSRTARSDSPTYLLRSSGPLIAIKFAPLAFAVALASRVFPHPGGPNSSTPDGVVRPSCLNRSAFRMGSQTAASRSALTSWRAPTSCQVTSGIVAKPSRRAEGWTFPTAVRKSAIVTAKDAISAVV